MTDTPAPCDTPQVVLLAVGLVSCCCSPTAKVLLSDASEDRELDQQPVVSTVTELLRSLDLECWVGTFESKGYDDLALLCRMSNGEFSTLAHHTGMSRRPGHVSKLRQFLRDYNSRLTSTPSPGQDDGGGDSGDSESFTPRRISRHSSTITPSRRELEERRDYLDADSRRRSAPVGRSQDYPTPDAQLVQAHAQLVQAQAYPLQAEAQLVQAQAQLVQAQAMLVFPGSEGRNPLSPMVVSTPARAADDGGGGPVVHPHALAPLEEPPVVHPHAMQALPQAESAGRRDSVEADPDIPVAQAVEVDANSAEMAAFPVPRTGKEIMEAERRRFDQRRAEDNAITEEMEKAKGAAKEHMREAMEAADAKKKELKKKVKAGEIKMGDLKRDTAQIDRAMQRAQQEATATASAATKAAARQREALLEQRALDGPAM
jgi:hypothetical protein